MPSVWGIMIQQHATTLETDSRLELVFCTIVVKSACKIVKLTLVAF